MTERERRRAEARIGQAFSVIPGSLEVLKSHEPLETKRRRLQDLFAGELRATFEDNPDVAPLICVLMRNAIKVFNSLLSPRNERVCGFSMLEYIDRIMQADRVGELPRPSSGFLLELLHLCRGVVGNAQLYEEGAPAFTKHKGRAAARRRSSYLSRLARSAQRVMDSYPNGLDHEVQRKRSRNKQRMLRHFDVTDLEWDDWQWQSGNIIRDADTLGALVKLSDEEREAVVLAREVGIPFGITPYYASLIDPDPETGDDRAVRAQVIPSLHYVRQLSEMRRKSEKSMDFMLEHDTSPIDGVTRRYPMICILKPMLTCPQICVYCQRNWEITDVNAANAVVCKEDVDRAIAWIGKHPEIREVLITGGDPLLLSDDRIESTLFKLTRLEQIERIRIGTRIPVTMPQRVTASLARDISHFHIPGRREILIVTHFEHPYEITPQAMEAVQRFRREGMEVYNQQVFTFFTSRRFEVCALRTKLRLIGVTPYYTFNTKGKEETADYRVPIARLLQEQKEETRLLPGATRTDEVVFNVPGLGKNYLRAQQHHDIVAILPDGRRVYEFHPWEKNISPADTYLYTDVSIHSYLKRLPTIDENPRDYRSIWYYY